MCISNSNRTNCKETCASPLNKKLCSKRKRLNLSSWPTATIAPNHSKKVNWCGVRSGVEKCVKNATTKKKARTKKARTKKRWVASKTSMSAPSATL